jgi:hypothetical protein
LSGVWDRVYVGSGSDSRKRRFSAGPPCEGVSNGILANVETGVRAKAFKETSAAQVGSRKYDTRYHWRGSF